MKKMLLLVLLVPLWGAGCTTAGTAAQLTAYDNINAAAKEAIKGVVAYDTAVRLGTAKGKAALLVALKKGIKNSLLKDKITDEKAEDIASRVILKMTSDMANYDEQQRRRQAWFDITMDNLQYIQQVAADAQAFEIYRSDVGAQWKAYLQAQARARLRKAETK